jgi:hypothetical protein
VPLARFFDRVEALIALNRRGAARPRRNSLEKLDEIGVQLDDGIGGAQAATKQAEADRGRWRDHFERLAELDVFQLRFDADAAQPSTTG